MGDPFEWSYEQHGVVVCPDGDIMMFDNGHYRSKRKGQLQQGERQLFQRCALPYDREERTIRQVWQYGKEAARISFLHISVMWNIMTKAAIWSIPEGLPIKTGRTAGGAWEHGWNRGRV